MNAVEPVTSVVSTPVSTPAAAVAATKVAAASPQTGAPSFPPVDYGPPDRDGNGWIDPPGPTDYGQTTPKPPPRVDVTA